MCVAVVLEVSGFPEDTYPSEGTPFSSGEVVTAARSTRKNVLAVVRHLAVMVAGAKEGVGRWIGGSSSTLLSAEVSPEAALYFPLLFLPLSLSFQMPLLGF